MPWLHAMDAGRMAINQANTALEYSMSQAILKGQLAERMVHMALKCGSRVKCGVMQIV